MKYTNEEWTVEKLLQAYDKRLLFLTPPYQRNDVWSLRAQQMLIDTILAGQPMPNFFFLLRPDGVFEVVDGQQRIRTILGYWKNLIPDLEGFVFEKRLQTLGDRKHFTHTFLNYRLSICTITEMADGENIEYFYSKVNSTGLRLNRPELKKAEYLTTNFLRLLQQLTILEEIKSLRLFSSITSSRMNDLDFISELVALLKYGISDKKEKVDELYEDDISDEEFDILYKKFRDTMAIFNRFDRFKPIIRTRYKQKNDFYSLFYFVACHSNESPDVLDYFYAVLVKIGPFIKPSEEECEPLMQYAYNCVTQSNSKSARQERNVFFESLLLNKHPEPNAVQSHIVKFFKMNEPFLRQVGIYYTLNCESIKLPEQTEFAVVR